MWFQIRNYHQDEKYELPGDAAELGRAHSGEKLPHFQIRDIKVSRRQMGIHRVADNRALLKNLSTSVPVMVVGEKTIHPGQRREVSLPVRLFVGDTRIEVHAEYRTLAAAGAAETGEIESPPAAGGSVTLDQMGSSPPAETLVDWFETLVGVLQSAVDPASFYAHSARALNELFGMDYGLVLHRAGDDWDIEAQHPRHVRGFSRNLLDEMLQKRKALCVDLPASDDLSESLRGFQAAVAAPIFDEQGEIIAALYAARQSDAYSGRSRQLIRPMEAHLVRVLATAVGTGIARLESRAHIERIQTEMDLARRIQAGFFPTEMPAVPGYSLAGHTQPAADTGGDYFDVLPLDNGQIGLVIADVCGHGFGPSLLMASMRATLRGLAPIQHDPAKLMTDLNRTLHGELQRGFITVLYGIFDPATHRFRYANAGHGPAVAHVRAADGHVRLLAEDDCRNLPVGVSADVEYEICEAVQLSPGDTMVLGSDGLIETNPAFGMDEFGAMLAKNCGLSAQQVIEKVLHAAQASAARRHHDDDLTLLAICREK